MTEKPIFHPTYCSKRDDRVMPGKCKVCHKCWLFFGGVRHGRCVYGGPYPGYTEPLPVPKK